MDHLPRPSDYRPLDITVPFLADKAPAYDGLDFKTFPLRHGHTLETLRHDSQETTAFLQSWLYFGLLHTALGSTFHLKDFVTRPATGEAPFVTSACLDAYLRKRHRRLLLQAVILGPLTCCLVVPSGITRTRNVLTDTAITSRNLDTIDDSHPVTEERAAVLLSIRVLVQSFGFIALPYRFLPSSSHLYYPRQGSITFAYLEARLGQTPGWCVHQVRNMFMNRSYIAALYLASYRRHPRPWVNHEPCASWDRCVANNIDNDSFATAHVTEGCACAHVSAVETDMIDILEAGGIPVIEVTVDGSGRSAVRYVAASPGMNYVAISHLWSDGLGSPHSNSLPRCQLERIVSRVRAANVAVMYGYALRTSWIRTPPWVYLSNSHIYEAVLLFKNALHRLAASKRHVDRVYIWLDVFCVPVLGKQKQPQHLRVPTVGPPLADASASMRLKRAALERMIATYAWASFVLVLDEELVQGSPNEKGTELWGRLCSVGWNQRCWTYLEQSLSAAIVYCSAGGYLHREPWVEFPSYFRGTHDLRSDPIFTLSDELKAASRPQAIATGIRRKREFVLPPIMGDTDPKAIQLKLFVDVWNALIVRTTTKWEDALTIMASLLNLSSSEIIRMQPEDQMKAIIAAQEHLPLSLLMTPCARFGNGRVPHEVDNEDRWIPRFPHGGRRLFLHKSLGSEMAVKPEGLIFTLSTEDGVSLTIRPHKHMSTWRIMLPQVDSEQRLVMRVYPECDPGIDVPVISLDAGNLIMVYVTRRSHVDHTHFTGFCAIIHPTPKSGRPRRLDYIGPVRWAWEGSEATDASEAAIEAEILPNQCQLLLECAISKWPSLRTRNDLMQDRDDWLVSNFSDPVWLVSLVSFSFSVAGGVLYIIHARFHWRISSTIHAIFFTALLVFLGMSVTNVIVVGALKDAKRLLHLHRMNPGFEQQKAWWLRLEEALPPVDAPLQSVSLRWWARVKVLRLLIRAIPNVRALWRENRKRWHRRHRQARRIEAEADEDLIDLVNSA